MIDVNKLLFNIDIKGNAPLHGGGSILVAEPFLAESYFNHAVICLVDHDYDGSMGVVLNQPTDHTLGAIVPFINDDISIKVYCGGPMSTERLYFLHALGPLVPGGREIVPGLWLGGDFNVMAELLNEGQDIAHKTRFFIGYSGWSRGQLEHEIEEHTWAVGKMPQDPSQIFDGSGDHYWHRAVKDLGPSYRGWLYHPQYPVMN